MSGADGGPGAELRHHTSSPLTDSRVLRDRGLPPCGEYHRPPWATFPTASATADANGDAAASVTCPEGRILYGANYTTTSLVSANAAPLNGDTTYNVTLAGAAAGDVLNVYGICGPA